MRPPPWKEENWVRSTPMTFSMHSNGSQAPVMTPMCGMLSWPYGPPWTEGSVIGPASFVWHAVTWTVVRRRQRPICTRTGTSMTGAVPASPPSRLTGSAS